MRTLYSVIWQLYAHLRIYFCQNISAYKNSAHKTQNLRGHIDFITACTEWFIIFLEHTGFSFYFLLAVWDFLISCIRLFSYFLCRIVDFFKSGFLGRSRLGKPGALSLMLSPVLWHVIKVRRGSVSMQIIWLASSRIIQCLLIRKE